MIRTSTPTPGRRQRRREERTGDLLDAAMRIVVDEGFDGLTMPHLAERADAAVGALYRYFDSKDALVAALQIRAIGRFDTFLADRVARARTPVTKIRAAASSWTAFADADPAHFLLVERSLSDPRVLLTDDAARAVDAALAPVLARCASLIAAAADAGEIAPGDANVRAHALWAAVHGAGQMRKRDRLVPRSLRADRVRDAIVDALLAGWR